ncbi:MAG: hypothetical protein P1V36_12130, partial [Planctomycetota bacterium]|nr:hypothetical protein [Planctomycetota bacterium]
EWIQKAITSAPSLEKALAEAKRRQTLLFWYIPAVEGQHVILPHLLDRYVMTGPLSDPDVTALLNRRFVCLKLPAGGALAQKYGLSAPKFVQPGFLVLKPDGTVVHRTDRIYCFQGAWWDALLRRILADAGEAEGRWPALDAAVERARRKPTPDHHLMLAIEAMAGGAFERARALLRALIEEDGGDEAARLFRAALALRERDAATAWAQLESSFTRALLPISEPIRARALLGQGRYAECIKLVEWRNTVDGDRGMVTDELWFRLGQARWATRDEAGARAAWEKTMATGGRGLWAARADACLQRGTDGRAGEAPFVRGMDSPRWFEPTAYPDAPGAEAPRDSQRPRTTAAANDIIRQGVAFLLEQQRADGSWPGFRWGAGSENERENKVDPGAAHNRNIDVAIAAACATALHRYYALAPKTIEAALRRADRYLVPNRILGLPLEEDRSQKVARRPDDACWVYADAYRLRYLTQRLYAYEPPQRALARDLMQEWIKGLRKHQVLHAGNIPHYSYRSVFSTAAITACLHEAADKGLRVPRAMFAEAGKALAAARGADSGLYGYLMDNPKVTRSRLGAANRQPLCVWVQWRNGVVKADRIPPALDVFLEAYEDSAAIARKTNFHVPSLGHTAGYYFFHNFHAACVAARDAYPNASAYMQKLRVLLCSLPEVDGTFIDSGFSYGKCYSTAMALQCLHLLTTPLPPR